jgi:hypothetical protein
VEKVERTAKSTKQRIEEKIERNRQDKRRKNSMEQKRQDMIKTNGVTERNQKTKERN